VYLELSANARGVDVRLVGRATVGEFDVARLTFASDPRALEVLKRVEVDHAWITDDIKLGRVGIRARGSVIAVLTEDSVAAYSATAATFTRVADGAVLHIIGVLERSAFEHLRVRIASTGGIWRGTGDVSIIEARGALITGETGSRPRTTGRLTLHEAFVGEAGDAEALRYATIRDVCLASASARRLIQASAEAAIFDPSPRSLAKTLSDIDEDERSSVAELLFRHISEKAPRAATVDSAAVEVLRNRSREESWRTSDKWLLKVYGMFGYGRRVVRPLLMWLVITGSVFFARCVSAASRRGGAVSGGVSNLVVHSWHTALSAAGDSLLTIALLPFSWNSSNAHAVDVSSGLYGGYLTALRVVEAVLLLLAANAVRHRLLVRSRSSHLAMGPD
jgi:hypothetical protein